MRLQLDLTKEEIEQIILNHVRSENGLQRQRVTIEWSVDHNLKIVQDEPADSSLRTWLTEEELPNDPD